MFDKDFLFRFFGTMQKYLRHLPWLEVVGLIFLEIVFVSWLSINVGVGMYNDDDDGDVYDGTDGTGNGDGTN